MPIGDFVVFSTNPSIICNFFISNVKLFIYFQCEQWCVAWIIKPHWYNNVSLVNWKSVVKSCMEQKNVNEHHMSQCFSWYYCMFRLIAHWLLLLHVLKMPGKKENNLMMLITSFLYTSNQRLECILNFLYSILIGGGKVGGLGDDQNGYSLFSLKNSVVHR